MSFLSPLYLALAAGAAVPLLIHLMRRRAGSRVEFPAARYLARAEQEHRRTLRLRNLLLMLVRVAAILFAAAAAAKPVGRWFGSGHAPTALAVVIDNSMSSGLVVDGAPLLDRLKRAALDAIGRASASDRVWLVTAEGTVHGGSPAAVREVVSRLTPLAGAGDLRRAVGAATAAVRGSGIDARQVGILTDGQRSSWSDPPRLTDVATVIWTPEFTAPPTHGVISAEGRPARWTPRGAIAARIRATDSASYRVTLAGRTLSRGTAAATDEIIVRAQPPERGWVAGTIELEPDELTADNVRHFAIWLGAPTGVRATPGAGPFASDALDVLARSGRIVAGGDVEIASAEELTSLPAMIVAPSDPVRLGAANRALERAGIPWRFGDRKTDRVSVSGAGIRDVEAFSRYELVARSGVGSDTLAVAEAKPWIVSGPGYVLLASPLSDNASTMPIRASFIPWLASIIGERLSGEASAILEAAPGQRVRLPSWVESVEHPDGSRTAVSDSMDAPLEPGVLFLLRGARRAGAVIVNPPAAESELQFLPRAELAARLTDSSATKPAFATTAARFAEAAFRAGTQKPLVQPLVIALLGMLLMETLLIVARRPPAAAS